MATKKGQQSIMANQALIQASRGTGEQFIDYGAVMQPAITGILKEMQIADNKMDRFINALPPGANIEKLPEGMRPEVERYLRDAKDEYAAAADVASKLSPRDPGYREAIDKMNSIKTGFINLNKNLESHLANRIEFIQDKNDLSGSLPDNDNIFLTSVYAGDYDGFKVTGGELEFLDKSTNKYRRNSEFPQYSLTDAIGANKITNLRFNARKNGLQGIVDTEGYQMGVSNLFKELGTQGVIDMAFDGLDNVAGSFVDTEIRNSEKFKNLSDEQWAVEREKLKTKEGFSNYFAPFQQHVGRLVNAGAMEGKAIYDNQQLKKEESVKGIEGNTIWGSWRKPTVIIDMAEQIKAGKNSNIEFIDGWDGNVYWPQQNGTFKVGNENGPYTGKKEVIRTKNWMYSNFRIPISLRNTKDTARTKSSELKFDFAAGLPSGKVDFTTKFTKD